MIELTLPLPPVLNSLYRQGRGHIYKSKEGKEWQELAAWKAKEQMGTRRPFKHLLSMDIQVYYSRDRDLDSSLKLLMDSFEGVVYENDIQIDSLAIEKQQDKERPRIEVKII